MYYNTVELLDILCLIVIIHIRSTHRNNYQTNIILHIVIITIRSGVTSARASSRAWTPAHVYIYIYMYISILVYAYVCMYIYIYIYICDIVVFVLLLLSSSLHNASRAWAPAPADLQTHFKPQNKIMDSIRNSPTQRSTSWHW